MEREAGFEPARIDKTDSIQYWNFLTCIFQPSGNSLNFIMSLSVTISLEGESPPPPEISQFFKDI